jgi:hypothetical protein
LVEEAFPGLPLGDGSAVRVRCHLGLYYLGDVQGANLVTHKIVEPRIDIAISKVVDALSGGSGVQEGLEGLVRGLGSRYPGSDNKPLREGHVHGDV